MEFSISSQVASQECCSRFSPSHRKRFRNMGAVYSGKLCLRPTSDHKLSGAVRSSNQEYQEMSGAKLKCAPHRSTSLEMPPSSPSPIHQAGMLSSPIGQARDVALLSISNPPSWSAVLTNRPGEGCVPPLHSNLPGQTAALSDRPGARRDPPLRSNLPSQTAALGDRPGKGCDPPLHSNLPSQTAGLSDRPGARRVPPLHPNLPSQTAALSDRPGARRVPPLHPNLPSQAAALSDRPGTSRFPPLHSNLPSQTAALCDRPGARCVPPLHPNLPSQTVALSDRPGARRSPPPIIGNSNNGDIAVSSQHMTQDKYIAKCLMCLPGHKPSDWPHSRGCHAFFHAWSVQLYPESGCAPYYLPALVLSFSSGGVFSANILQK